MTLARTLLEARELDDDAEAERRIAEAVAAARRDPTVDRPDVANAMVYLAEVQERLGDFERAEATLTHAHRLFVRSCGHRDARTRHAELSIADLLRRAGLRHRALTAYRKYGRARGERPSWLCLVIEELERGLGETGQADRSLDDAVKAARTDRGGDPMTSSPTIIRTAKRLAELGRHDDARRVLDEAIASAEDVIAGRRMSMSARVHADVVRELGEARAAILEMVK